MTRASAGALLALAAVLAGCGSGGSTGGTAAGATAAQPSYAANPSTAVLLRRAALAPCPASDHRARGGRLPAVTLPCLGDGPAVNLAGLRGAPTVVSVWASWCVPCQAEAPRLVAVARSLGHRVRFLGVDTLDDPRSALDFAAHVGMRFPSVRDDDKRVLLALRSLGPPVTVFVRPDGSVAHVKYGEYGSVAQLRADVATYLGVSA